MDYSNQNTLTIAGMGRSGLAVANYLTQAGIEYACCDDKEDYPDCVQMLEGYGGYVIKSPGIPVEKLPGVASRNMINDVELFLRLSKKPVIMVTGTNGKSTVVSLLEHILEVSGVNAIACGNNGVPVMHAYERQADIYILELSSYQLENISSYACVSSVLLNIGIDHVDRYPDMQAYESVKKKVYTSSIASVHPVEENGDINYHANVSGYTCVSPKGVVNYLLKSGDIIRNNEVYCAVSGLGLIGRHNYLNVCASLALIDGFGLTKNLVIQALESFKGLPHRMELVCEDNQGRQWINDSKSTNVHSLDAVLSSRQEPICLILGGRGKGEDYSQVFSRYHSIIKELVIYGEDSGLINSQASSIENRVIVDTVSEAVVIAFDYSSDVLFSPACASFDQYRDFNERGDDFKQQVRRVVSC
jgi:UDP-N-acetylmuramoylalanine--D-glutamate ligase